MTFGLSLITVFGLSFIATFSLSSACYYVVLFVFLLQRFIFVLAIQKRKTDLINRKYQIMIINILKNKI